MKKPYKTPKAIHVDFHYEEQVAASSSGGVALYGDPQQIGRCQQSDPTSCVHFWTANSAVCESAPLSLR